MSVCAFNFLYDGEYSKLPLKTSYLLIFPDDKAEILAANLSKF